MFFFVCLLTRFFFYVLNTCKHGFKPYIIRIEFCTFNLNHMDACTRCWLYGICILLRCRETDFVWCCCTATIVRTFENGAKQSESSKTVANAHIKDAERKWNVCDSVVSGEQKTDKVHLNFFSIEYTESIITEATIIGSTNDDHDFYDHHIDESNQLNFWPSNSNHSFQANTPNNNKMLAKNQCVCVCVDRESRLENFLL